MSSAIIHRIESALSRSSNLKFYFRIHPFLFAAIAVHFSPLNLSFWQLTMRPPRLIRLSLTFLLIEPYPPQGVVK
jgi:hypothetical protein